MVFSWAVEHGVELLQVIGIVGALGFNGYSLRRNAQVQEALFVRKMLQDHRTIWIEFIGNPKLGRVLRANVNLRKKPVTGSEMFLVNLVILHLSGVLNAVDKGIMNMPSGLELDLGWFFSLPIPYHVWTTMREFRSPRLIQFVESVLERKKEKNSL